MPLQAQTFYDGLQRPLAPGTGRVGVLYTGVRDRPGHAYERAAWTQIATRLARLQGLRFAGDYDAGRDYPHAPYFVPDDALIADTAAALGIGDARDLFGGVVPHAFIATKAITQPLVGAGAAAPAGWSGALHADRADVVLRGHTAFDTTDARRAAERLLRHGPFRTKPARASGGRGQRVVTDMAAFEAVLVELAEHGIALDDGLVLEENLQSVVTYSIGRVLVGDLLVCYAGTQHETTDNRGRHAYGGSDLTVVRGDFDALLGLTLPADLRTAIEQACAYERRALKAWPGMILSRSNYDVAHGTDGKGQERSGVLEQSWRIGGASPAEVLALEAFAADASLAKVQACCRERYGTHRPPAGAEVFFDGEDPQVGPVVLYAGLGDVDACAAS